MTRPRIAFVSLHTSPAETPGAGDAGGMNVVERHWAQELAFQGYDVELFTRRSSPEQPDAVALGEHMLLRHLPAGPAEPLPKSAIDAHIGEFADAMSQLPAPDVVHAHHWMSGVAALESGWQSPVVVSYHSVAAHPDAALDAGEPPESPARNAGERHVAAHADAIVAVSTSEALTIVDRCGADPDRVDVVAPGVDLDLFTPEAGRRSKTGRLQVAFAARLQPLKGADVVVSALASMDPSLRPRLVIAGDVSADFADYRAELQHDIEAHGLVGDVEFAGSLTPPRLASLMASSDVFTVPSHSETFGLVALEAAACGAPVVTAATGGLREVVVEGVTGCLVSGHAPQDWADALTRLLEDPASRQKMGTMARVHARRFTWAESARRLAAVYRRLLPR